MPLADAATYQTDVMVAGQGHRRAHQLLAADAHERLRHTVKEFLKHTRRQRHTLTNNAGQSLGKIPGTGISRKTKRSRHAHRPHRDIISRQVAVELVPCGASDVGQWDLSAASEDVAGSEL